MEIVIQNQKAYDEAVRGNLHEGNELVIQNCAEFISVHTDVTVAGNGRCKSIGDNPITVTVKENGAVTADGKTKVIGSGSANIAAKGNCTITLDGAATAHASGNCTVTLKGKSRIAAHDSCTVHAYDESAVSAFGKSKVFTYQKAVAQGTDITSLAGHGTSTLIGKKRCSIKARDNCLVFATDGCKVEAADNCLVIANKAATIVSQNNCVVMTNDNPDVTLFDQADHLNLDTVTDLNIMGCIKRLSRSKAFVERPYVSLQLMMANIPPERKEAVNRRLVTMGCKDQASTKNYLYNLIMVDSPKPQAARKENGYMER
jgi:hypothetical protein